MKLHRTAAWLLLPLLAATCLAQVGPRGRVPVPVQPVGTRQQVAQTQRAVVIIGGWSNVPEDFLNTTLVDGLAKELWVTPSNWPNAPFRKSTGPGSRKVLLAHHRDEFGDIPANAEWEARQIVQFLNEARSQDPTIDTKFDLIGFSMGGLVSRVMILDQGAILGDFAPANLVTMGTPNHGVSTFIAGGGVLMNTAQHESSVGVRQMDTLGPFLRQLNTRAIPAAVRVSTIAGSALVETLTPPHQHDTQDVPCTHMQKCPHMKNVLGRQVPEHPLGCPTHASDKKDMPCIHPPVRNSVEVGADGLVRILSVKLRPGEAQNIAGQHVINNLWHTSGTMTTARTPAVRPFINALGCQPENLAGNPPPITGSAVQANHFFTDSRVLDLMRQILN